MIYVYVFGMSGCLMVFDSHFANWTSVYTCVYCILKRRPLCTLQVSTTRWSVAMWACGLLADIGVGGTPHPRRRKLWFEHDHLLFLNFNWFDMDLKDCPCMVTQTSFTGLRKILKITGPWQVCCAFKRAIQIQDWITCIIVFGTTLVQMCFPDSSRRKNMNYLKYLNLLMLFRRVLAPCRWML